MMMTTFGAPAGALIGWGNAGLDSLIVRPMTPRKRRISGRKFFAGDAAPAGAGSIASCQRDRQASPSNGSREQGVSFSASFS